MPPKQKALWLLGMMKDQKSKPFSTAEDVIAACDEIITIFREYHPPLVSQYWHEVRNFVIELSK